MMTEITHEDVERARKEAEEVTKLADASSVKIIWAKGTRSELHGKMLKMGPVHSTIAVEIPPSPSTLVPGFRIYHVETSDVTFVS